MTVPVSTAAAALAQLLSQVQTQVATDALAKQVLVVIGEPGMDLPSDIIQLGTNIRRQVAPEAFMGGYQMAGPLKETYEIECTVSSWSGDPDPVAIVDRAYALAGYIEVAVRTDPTLGATVLISYPSGTTGGNATWTTDPVGRLAELTVYVHVETLN